MRNSKNYKSLPYNPSLRQRAKELRKAGILHEVLLWNRLKDNKLNGLDFDRQKIIGDYIVDFYCAQKDVIIEVDGYTHGNKAVYDKKRDEFFNSLGLEAIHILAVDVLQNLGAVLEFLENHPALSGTLRFALGQGAHISRPLITRAPYSSRTRPPEEGNLSGQ